MTLPTPTPPLTPFRNVVGQRQDTDSTTLHTLGSGGGRPYVGELGRVGENGNKDADVSKLIMITSMETESL